MSNKDFFQKLQETIPQEHIKVLGEFLGQNYSAWYESQSEAEKSFKPFAKLYLEPTAIGGIAYGEYGDTQDPAYSFKAQLQGLKKGHRPRVGMTFAWALECHREALFTWFAAKEDGGHSLEEVFAQVILDQEAEQRPSPEFDADLSARIESARERITIRQQENLATEQEEIVGEALPAARFILKARRQLGRWRTYAADFAAKNWLRLRRTKLSTKCALATVPFVFLSLSIVSGWPGFIAHPVSYELSRLFAPKFRAIDGLPQENFEEETLSIELSSVEKWSRYLLRRSAEGGYAAAESDYGYDLTLGLFVKTDHQKAFQMRMSAASKGNTSAIAGVGFHYDYGLGVKRDEEKAFKWYRKAALAGNVMAANNVGWSYYEGNYVEVDFEKAFYFVKKASDAGMPLAHNNLGIFYENGVGTEPNFRKAEIHYKKAIEAGNLYGAYNLADLYLGDHDLKDYQKAREWFERAIQLGDDLGYVGLGRIYEEGLGVPANPKQAIAEYLRAADAEVVDAYWRLGNLFASDALGEPDLDQAKAWLLKIEGASKPGESAAWEIAHLAELYLDGRVFKQNFAEAERLFLIAAKLGSTWAMTEVGSMYEKSKVEGKGIKDAIYWYEEAAENGSAWAHASLGYIHLFEEHDGLDNDVSRGKKHLVKAAELGNTWAMRSLGDAYRDRRFDPEENDKTHTEFAAEWYKRALEAGDSRGAVRLFVLYTYPPDSIDKNAGQKALEYAVEAFNSGNYSGISVFIREYIDISDGKISLKPEYSFPPKVSNNQEYILEVLERASHEGNANAMQVLGHWLVAETEDPEKTEAGLKWLAGAADKGNYEALKTMYSVQLEEARTSFASGKTPDLSWLEGIAALGIGWGIDILNQCYLDMSLPSQLEPGWLSVLIEDALKWGEDRDLAFQIASIYEHGTAGVLASRRKALSWYETANKLGHPHAPKAVAELLSKGPRGLRNLDEAISHVTEMEGGTLSAGSAYFIAGQIGMLPDPTGPEITSAIQLLEFAKDENVPGAAAAIGAMNIFGPTAARAPDHGMQLLESRVSADDPSAKAMLGLVHLTGAADASSLQTAATLCRAAANEMVIEAMSCLGSIYLVQPQTGLFVSKKEAEDLLRSASEYSSSAAELLALGIELGVLDRQYPSEEYYLYYDALAKGSSESAYNLAAYIINVGVDKFLNEPASLQGHIASHTGEDFSSAEALIRLDFLLDRGAPFDIGQVTLALGQLAGDDQRRMVELDVLDSLNDAGPGLEAVVQEARNLRRSAVFGDDIRIHRATSKHTESFADWEISPREICGGQCFPRVMGESAAADFKSNLYRTSEQPKSMPIASSNPKRAICIGK